MTTDVVPPGSAPAPPPSQNIDANFNDLCKKVRREASLTPPAVIDDLCNGVPTEWICIKASYVAEVLEIARILQRGELLRFKVDC
jgi:hypothetical protein